jgi:Outer membrane protein Omp28/Secretion system C-terminal sorting domain
MQKHFYSLLFAGLFASSLLAQPTSVTRYVLAEHFTNSRCSICASRNPAFYNTITPQSDRVHHISIHPAVPYSNCIFYQANTADNSARANHYGIAGTPRVALNGTLLDASTPLLPAATLSNYLNQTSNLNVQVSETNTTVTVRLRSFGAAPTGEYRLMVALAEKEVNYNSPNGESVHRDVLRDFLTDATGDVCTIPAVGQSQDYTFTKTSNANWVPAQLYVIAWVERVSDGEVLNSGTKFDPIVSSVQDLNVETLQLRPNPASEWTTATLPDGQTAQQVRVVAADGREVRTEAIMEANLVQINVQDIPSGWYSIEIRTENKVYIARLVR